MGNQNVPKMDPVAATVEKMKHFAKSTQSFISTVLLRPAEDSPRRNPIEILKRLQREAFSDLMKLRDRQEKVEKLLTFYAKSEAKSMSTHLRGEVDLVGAVLLMGDVDEEHCEAIDRAGIRTGLDSRFVFVTSVRDKDSLSVEFTTNQKAREMAGDYMFRSSLSLAKVVYQANTCDWLSGFAIPVGAQSRDCDVTSNYSQQGKGLTDMPYFGPPLLHKHIGSGLGITVSKWNIVASLAHSVSATGGGMHSGFDGIGHCLHTFGQVVCQLPRQTKLSFSGLHQTPRLPGQCIRLGALAIPIGSLVPEVVVASDNGVEASSPSLRGNAHEFGSTRAVALKIESNLDEYTRLGAWVEMNRSNPRHMQWAVSMTDISEDELGWGLSLGGINEDPNRWDQFQVESYVKLNLGKKFCLKPGVAYVIDGSSRSLAFMLRCNWSL